ncbi:MAG: ABC transporter ATP-binding protein [Oscillospiraceae bacterium]|nr:ABC transporter ATP-binding protein [Oscillospiraceae bacterium]
MGKSIIEVKDVSVAYIVGDLRNIGLKEYVMKKLTGKYKTNTFMAVDHVSFSLEQGDMLGIVGKNGAGKSTLLKVITQIMVPSTGYVKVNGKIAALLELASGFDNELNLKENAYLRGAMLGYTREYMNQKYPEILEFSELQEFEQSPLKVLSSGMKAKFAFALASMVEPEILILDEVLAVGDGAFRKKSEQKMYEIIENGKVTILVSHSVAQIRRMCNKVLWLDHGKQIAFGESKEICDLYEEFLKTGILPDIHPKS